MECFHCKGKMVQGTTPFSAGRNGYHVTWESVPAWVCTQCGEALIEEHEVNHIQQALDGLDRETEALTSKAG